MVWTMNLGYIAFELNEFSEKGLKKYFRRENLLDVAISAIWVVLFWWRMIYLILKTPFQQGSATVSQQLYLLLFGAQIVALTIRALFMFSNSSYLGTMIRAVNLMFVEIGKFLSIVCHLSFYSFFSICGE